jgi:hypothetical protein
VQLRFTAIVGARPSLSDLGLDAFHVRPCRHQQQQQTQAQTQTQGAAAAAAAAAAKTKAWGQFRNTQLSKTTTTTSSSSTTAFKNFWQVPEEIQEPQNLWHGLFEHDRQ